MTSQKKTTDRGVNLISITDLNMLKILNKTTKDLGIMEIKEMMNISHLSSKRHIGRLEKYNFILKEPPKKGRKIIIKITKKGKLLLSLFKK